MMRRCCSGLSGGSSARRYMRAASWSNVASSQTVSPAVEYKLQKPPARVGSGSLVIPGSQQRRSEKAAARGCSDQVLTTRFKVSDAPSDAYRERNQTAP